MDGVAQVSALGVGDSLDHVFSGHLAGDSVFAGSVAFNLGGVDAVVFAHGQRFTMGGRSRGTVRIDVVDGQLELVQLEVQLQHQRSVGSDGAGFHVSGGSIVHILTILLICLVGIGNGDGGVGGAGARIAMIQPVRIAVLIIEFHRVLGIGVGCPLGVQVIGTVIHAGGITSGEGNALVVFPTSEGVALTRGQTGGAVILNRDLTVVGDIFYRLGLVSVEVAVIGDTDSGRLVAPLGIQRHIAGDLHGTVGIVRRAGAVSLGVPAQEDLAVVDEAVAHNGGLGALGVLLGVGHGAGAAVGIVGHRVTGAVAYLGVQLIVRGDLGARIEVQTTIDRPAQEAVASIERELELSFQLGQLIGDGIALADDDLVKLLAVLIIHRHRIGGRYPLGVQGNVVGGHGLAVKHIGCALAQLVVVPTGKDIAVFTFRSGVMLIVGVARNAGLILYRLGLNGFTTADEHEVVAVAGVIELGVVVLVATQRPICRKRLEGKTGDGVLVLVSDIIACAGRGVAVMQLIAKIAGAAFAGLTRQDFHIVIGCFGTITGLGTIEVCAVQRHGINVDLVFAAAVARCPGAAAVISGPFGTDIRTVLGGDTQSRVLCRITEQTTIGVELHRILIALVVHTHNGRAVALDDLLGDGLGGETGVALGRGVGLAAGSAGLGLALLVGIAVIVGVLQPVNDGVAGVAVFPPLGVQGGGRRDAGEVSSRRQTLVSVPVDKGVAGLGGFSGSRGGFAIGVERRGHIAAAVGLEGEPIALFHLGIQGDVDTIDGDGVDLFGETCVFVPAGDGFVAADGEVHIFKGDFSAVCDRLGGDDTAIGRFLEEDVIAILKYGIDRDGLGCSNARDRAEVDVFVVPAGEYLAILRGNLGLQQGVAVLHDLLAEQSLTGIEFVGAISARIGHNAQDADIAAGRDGLNGGVIDLLDIIIGQYRDGYQRQTHAKSQQKTENSFFHCIHPLFSLCFRGHFLSCGVGPHMANGDKRRCAVTQSGSTSRLWLLSFRGRDAKPPFRCRYDVRCSHVSCGEEPEQTSGVFLRQINYTAIPTENQRLQEKYYGISTKQEEAQM